MKNLFAVCLFFSYLCTYSQVRNYGQELADLLYGKQIPKAIEYYGQYKDSISHPFITDSYHLMTSIYFNKQDTVDVLFPLFIDKYHGNIINDDVVNYLLEYVRVSRMKTIINEAENGGDIHIPILTDPLIIFTANYNGISLNTVFDTGCGYSILAHKDIAEKIGVKMLEEYTPRNTSEIEMQMNVAEGWLDSIRVGKLLIKNVPVIVFDRGFFQLCISDSLLSDKEVMAKMDSVSAKTEIIMGLPIISMLHHIQFDLDREEMIISFNHQTDVTKDENMFMESDRLFLNAQINDVDFTSLIDTGGNWGDLSVVLRDEFYQTHKGQLPTLLPKDADRIRECMIHGVDDIPFIRLNHSTIQLDNQFIDLGDDAVVFADRKFYLTKDGYVGLGLLKKLRKFTLDFDAMRLELK